jgi:hypothetical protein
MQGATSGICDIALSSFGTLMLGWTSANLFTATDAALAFPGYSMNSTPTRGQLRLLFDDAQTFARNRFLLSTLASIGWDYGVVVAGDFGRIDGQYDLWTMMHWARASRAVEPEVVTYGPTDWEREFTRLLVNHQTPTGFNWVLSALANHNDNIVGPAGRAGWAVNSVSPDAQRPLALVRAAPATLTEGASVSFSATAQVSDAPAWTWTLGNGDTRTGASFSYAFPDDGAFTVTPPPSP